MVEPADSVQESKRPGLLRRGCRGCLTCFGVLALLAGLAAVLVIYFPDTLRAVGIFAPPPEERFAGAPDPIAGPAVKGALEEAGFADAEVYVLPISGKPGQLTIVRVERQAVFEAEQEEELPIWTFFQALGRADPDGELLLERASIIIRDPVREQSVTFTTTQANLAAYAAGEVKREQFLAEVDFDLQAALDFFGQEALVERPE